MSRGQYEFDVWSYIARMGIRLRPARDTFFLDGDAVCAMRTCQFITQEDCEEFLHVDYKKFCCSAPGCQVCLGNDLELFLQILTGGWKASMRVFAFLPVIFYKNVFIFLDVVVFCKNVIYVKVCLNTPT